MLTIVDYGVGNLRSVYMAFHRLGCEAQIATTANEIRHASALVLPGVGAFGDAMGNLTALGMVEDICVAIRNGVPFLGICLGLQLLFEVSEELGEHRGMGVLAGKVRRFPTGLKVPQMGWNQVKQAQPSRLWQGVTDQSYAYFVHSYYVAPEDPGVIIGSTEYGEYYASAVAQDNLFAIQFHPEKSQDVGELIPAQFYEAFPMIVYPAIDLRNGLCVRLQQGKLESEIVFAYDPCEAAQRWGAEGAEWLHIVNLDGAFNGAGQVNLEALKRILASTRIPIQFGGGLRSLDDIAYALDLGVSRVVLGTVALQKPEVVANAIATWGAERVAVGIDARAGVVAVQGWTETSTIQAEVLANQLKTYGIERIIYTDIARDGMLMGVNVSGTANLAKATGLRVIASGGVSNLTDITALSCHKPDGVDGIIIGMALYRGSITLPDAIKAARGGYNAC